MLKILLNGYQGRMGKAIQTLSSHYELEIIGSDKGGGIEKIENCHVVIDFSHHSSINSLIDHCLKKQKPLIIGTTGHTTEEKKMIAETSKNIPIVYSSNFGIGTNVLFHLVEQSATFLSKDFHPEIIEIHHNNKKDAPSGTALTLGKILSEKYNQSLTFGRHGNLEGQSDNEIGIHALRGGDVTGTHTVYFLGNGETLELTHRSTDRKIFALGAIKAAIWIKDKKPGLYSMKDVLGLNI